MKTKVYGAIHKSVNTISELVLTVQQKKKIEKREKKKKPRSNIVATDSWNTLYSFEFRIESVARRSLKKKKKKLVKLEVENSER